MVSFSTISAYKYANYSNVSPITESGVVSFKFQLNVASYYQPIPVLIRDFDEDDRVKVTALPTFIHVSSIHRTSCSSQKF